MLLCHGALLALALIHPAADRITPDDSTLHFAFGTTIGAMRPHARPDPTATAVIDTAIRRMGGATALSAITQVHREMLTQWQSIDFTDHPYADRPSYETHADLRNYGERTWRNTRRFPTGGRWQEIVDIVNDTVAIRGAGGNWAPLNIAYVDERRELFATAPERLLLLAQSALDLRSGTDTSIAGTEHARIEATLEGFPATIFVRRSDGLPAMVRHRAAAPNDFGLVPWGMMEVETWYSRWQPVPGGAILPAQWDVRRAGRPYKRMTVLATTIDRAPVTDSFAVSEPLRAQYFATATRPMHDVPYDSARLIDDRFATFGARGAPVGAVKLGGRWVLLETGQGPLSAERATAALRSLDGGSTVAGAVITTFAPGNGGAAWLAAQRVPLWVAPNARPPVDQVLRGHEHADGRLEPVTAGRWVRTGSDSLWIEPIDFPDAPGSMFVYVPAWRWAYAQSAWSPFHTERLRARLAARGWPVDRIGSTRSISGAAP